MPLYLFFYFITTTPQFLPADVITDGVLVRERSLHNAGGGRVHRWLARRLDGIVVMRKSRSPICCHADPMLWSPLRLLSWLFTLHRHQMYCSLSMSRSTFEYSALMIQLYVLTWNLNKTIFILFSTAMRYRTHWLSVLTTTSPLLLWK